MRSSRTVVRLCSFNVCQQVGFFNCARSHKNWRHIEFGRRNPLIRINGSLRIISALISSILIYNINCLHVVPTRSFCSLIYLFSGRQFHWLRDSWPFRRRCRYMSLSIRPGERNSMQSYYYRLTRPYTTKWDNKLLDAAMGKHKITWMTSGTFYAVSMPSRAKRECDWGNWERLNKINLNFSIAHDGWIKRTNGAQTTQHAHPKNVSIK